MADVEGRRVIVTGGAGFIGSAVCRLLIRLGAHVCNIDKITYAANLNNLRDVAEHPKYRFERRDICDAVEMRAIFRDFRPDSILHLAAESHVDRSIADAAPFIRTNVVGTVTLLETALAWWQDVGRPEGFRFHHVSTDEVFGDLPLTGGAFVETSRYQPSSPYAASKAASDFMVSSWHRTFGLPTVISNCSNNYGPYQNTEKLIPLMIVRGLREEPLPVYGEGLNVRDWLHVDDHAEALVRVMTNGRLGESYNVGGNAERRNIDVVNDICSILDVCRPRSGGRRHADLVTFVTDRPGHDLRYAIDPKKIRDELGWRPKHTFEDGLRETVEWYVSNAWWWNAR